VKPSPFTYHRPGDVADAVTLLAELGEDGKVLAGGQSLVPLMSMRLGGRFIYAFDVSNPASPTVLWKRSNKDAGFTELGQSWS